MPPPARMTATDFSCRGCHVLTIAKLRTQSVDYYLSTVASGIEDYYAGHGEAPGVSSGGAAAAQPGLTGVVGYEPRNVRAGRLKRHTRSDAITKRQTHTRLGSHLVGPEVGQRSVWARQRPHLAVGRGRPRTSDRRRNAIPEPVGARVTPAHQRRDHRSRRPTDERCRVSASLHLRLRLLGDPSRIVNPTPPAARRSDVYAPSTRQG